MGKWVWQMAVEVALSCLSTLLISDGSLLQARRHFAHGLVIALLGAGAIGGCGGTGVLCSLCSLQTLNLLLRLLDVLRKRC